MNNSQIFEKVLKIVTNQKFEISFLFGCLYLKELLKQILYFQKSTFPNACIYRI